MADEAYRAVFLRVHPTGKMVLSLTTEPDGKEGEYAALVGAELGVPALDVKVVPADTDRFGEGHGFNTSPSAGTSAAIELDVSPDSLSWSNGGWVADGGGTKTIEDLALYAHGTGALPPGVEGGLDAQAVYRD